MSCNLPPLIKIAHQNHDYSQMQSPMQKILSGENAFYESTTYLADTKKDFAQIKDLGTCYSYRTESKVASRAKLLFALIFFPYGVYKALHALIGKVALLPASNPAALGLSAEKINASRARIPLDSDWKYKRLSVEVNGQKIDAMIVGKKDTFGNGKWILASNGNAEFYENKLSYNNNFRELLEETNANGLVFNYHAVGASAGYFPTRNGLKNAYEAMLNLLENKVNGIGAKIIISLGHSIGAGVQGDALKTHELKKEIQYVFVKSRTFSDLSTIASVITCRLLGFFVKVLGWNIDSLESSKKLQAPEIILQTANVGHYTKLNDSSLITSDGIITAEASLAKVLLDDDKCPKENKMFIGIPETHNEALTDPAQLAHYIEESLQNYYS